jgi:hypothetical protein
MMEKIINSLLILLFAAMLWLLDVVIAFITGVLITKFPVLSQIDIKPEGELYFLGMFINYLYTATKAIWAFNLAEKILLLLALEIEDKTKPIIIKYINNEKK